MSGWVGIGSYMVPVPSWQSNITFKNRNILFNFAKTVPNIMRLGGVAPNYLKGQNCLTINVRICTGLVVSQEKKNDTLTRTAVSESDGRECCCKSSGRSRISTGSHLHPRVLLVLFL